MSDYVYIEKDFRGKKKYLTNIFKSYIYYKPLYKAIFIGQSDLDTKLSLIGLREPSNLSTRTLLSLKQGLLPLVHCNTFFHIFPFESIKLVLLTTNLLKSTSRSYWTWPVSSLFLVANILCGFFCKHIDVMTSEIKLILKAHFRLFSQTNVFS